MELILHIGLPKTGTSAIQLFLWKNRERLLKKYGILYPETGIWFGEGPAHYPLTWFFMRRKDLPDRPDPFKLWEKIKEEALKKGAKRIILSSENFSVINPAQLKELFKDIDTTVVVYIRRQDKWVESSYKQAVKMGQFYPIENLLQKPPGHLFYDRYLEKWSLYFKIIPRIYDPKQFPNGNIIEDFVNFLQLSKADLETKLTVNKSLSVISTLALRKFNETFKPLRLISGKAFEFLSVWDNEFPHPLKVFFPLEKRLNFLAKFEDVNKKTAERWFNNKAVFALAEEELKFFKDQDKLLSEEKVIDREAETRYEALVLYLKHTCAEFKHLSTPKSQAP